MATGRSSGELPGTAEAAVVAEHWVDERIVDLHIDSPALGRVTLVRLVVPPGWKSRVMQNLPVLYLLHGAGDDRTSWTRETDIVELSAAEQVLVVVPDAGRVGLYTNWRSPDRAGTTPRWADFHFGELPRLLQRDYRAGPRRVVAGVSMGGYGAVRQAIREPGFFAAVASFSGLLHTTKRGIPAFVHAMLIREREKPGSLWGWSRSNSEGFVANDPYLLAEGLRGTALHLATGDGRPGPFDRGRTPAGVLEAIVGPTTRDLAAKLKDLQIPATTYFYPGTHTWPYWKRELGRSWTFLMRGLGQ